MDFQSSVSSENLLDLFEEVKNRALSKSRPVDLPKPVATLQLPLWGNEIRCMPNEILRSALFNAKNRNESRRYFKNESIAIIDQSARIKFTGEGVENTVL